MLVRVHALARRPASLMHWFCCRCRHKDAADADVLRILIATDNHLGFREHDPVRGGDSFEAFDEVLRIAKHEQVRGCGRGAHPGANGPRTMLACPQVDMVLLGGDLFHDNKPTRYTLHRCARHKACVPRRSR